MKKITLILCICIAVSASAQNTVDCGTVTDYDGNTYNTVVLGSQCWMRENLRTTHYTNGESIDMGSSASRKKAYRYSPNNNSSYIDTYGYLYNWCALMHGASSSEKNPSGVQGVCPKGWHVPSKTEWDQMTDFVRSQSQYCCGESKSKIAKALASKTGWRTDYYTGSIISCAVGIDQNSNNATGFSATPAGVFESGGYDFYWEESYDDRWNEYGISAVFWSATERKSESSSLFSFSEETSVFGAYSFSLGSVFDDLYTNNASCSKDYGLSVRCIRDASVCPTSVKDYDGNEYLTVELGKKCWMAENLRTTHYSNGESIPMGNLISQKYKAPYYFYPNYSSSCDLKYGYLYNWYAIMHGSAPSSQKPSGVQGICPTGWHLPSIDEWLQLSKFVSSQPAYHANGNPDFIAKSLASTWGWEKSKKSGTAGNDQTSNNKTGFAAPPAGYCTDPTGEKYPRKFYSFGTSACYWSTTEDTSFSSLWVKCFRIGGYYANGDREPKDYSLSVRCLQD